MWYTRKKTVQDMFLYRNNHLRSRAISHHLIAGYFLVKALIVFYSIFKL